MTLTKEKVAKNARTFYTSIEKYGFFNDNLVDILGEDFIFLFGLNDLFFQVLVFLAGFVIDLFFQFLLFVFLSTIFNSFNFSTVSKANSKVLAMGEVLILAQ